MREITRNTKVGGLEYPITFRVFDSLTEAFAQIGNAPEADVAVDAPTGAQEAVLGVINAAQEQGAKQGGKEVIRDAAEEAEFSLDEEGLALADCPEPVQEAVAGHQARAAKYVIGAPRGERGGMTKTKAREVGAKLREKLGDEALLALAREHGIDPAELGITSAGSNNE